MRAPIPSLPSRNVRNKKTRNPGFIGGAHWIICDRCGCAVRECDSRLTWEGYVVCPDDWEPRHPQDFVRAREDRIAPEGNNRPESADLFVNPFCTTHTNIIDDAIIDCLIIDGEIGIPQSTFNMSTL
jgi:hypothetical protein